MVNFLDYAAYHIQDDPLNSHCLLVSQLVYMYEVVGLHISFNGNDTHAHTLFVMP